MKFYASLFLALGWIFPLPAVADESCRHVTLTPTPAWTYSGAWAPDGRLLLVDVGTKAVRAYDPHTGRGEVGWRSAEGLDQPGGPALVQRHGDAVLLEVQDVLHAWAPGNDPKPMVPLVEDNGPAGLRSVHSWAAGEEHVLVYADHYHPVAGWRSVLAVAGLDDPSRLHVVETVPFDGPNRSFYTNSQSFLAASGETGWVLTLEPRPHLIEIDLPTGTSRRLPLPAALAPRVELPPAQGLDTLVDQQAALATTHRPAGLYVHDGVLYVLSRHPQSESPWRLTTYDPVQGRALSATILPTRAAHLVVVPGEMWAVVEKGPVEGFGRQNVFGVVLLPASQLTGGTACRRAELSLQP